MKKEVFMTNRKNLMDKLGDNCAVVLFSGEQIKRSADEAYDFVTNKNFFYMTGIDGEVNIALLMMKVNGKVQETLFIKAIDPEYEKWYGETIRPEAAKEQSGVENVAFLPSFEGTLHNAITKMEITDIYFDLERDSFNAKKSVSEEAAQKLAATYPQVKINDVYNKIALLRMVKCQEEVAEMQKAIDITIKGVHKVLKNARPGMVEHEMEAYFDFVLKSNGVKELAFPTIAAGGKNAAILHYSTNNCAVKDGEMLQLDLGAVVGHYCGDISRALPVSGKFTKRQREVYEAVLRVNKKCIEAIKPGVSFLEWNAASTDLIAEECINLGLIKDKSEVRKYYWHSIGHSLGLDCHDVGPRDCKFKPGMVWTVEPGIYIAEEGIGVRIEDDVLVTENGYEVLTKEMIKEADEIEAFMAK